METIIVSSLFGLCAGSIVYMLLHATEEECVFEPGHICIWRWSEAPDELRLCGCGGDEDWVALIPPHYKSDDIEWLKEGTPFGCCTVHKVPHPTLDGYEVLIGCHA